MLNHLRAHNRAIEKGLRDINGYLERVSKGTQLNDDGKARIQYKDVGVHVLALPGINLVIFKTFINFLPDPTGGKILALYYDLLDKNDAPDTGLAYFSIVAAEEVGAERDVISVETKRPLIDMSFEEFTNCLTIVGEVANVQMVRLAEEFGADPVP